MIPFLLIALAASQPGTACPEIVTAEALICRALAAQAQSDTATAAQSFEQAAVAASQDDPQVPRLWAAAGNMWIAARQDGRAAIALDKALASPLLVGEQRGEVLLDRARVAEAQGDLKTARARFDEAVPLVEDEAFTWYFGTALAIREGDGPRAVAAAARALSLDPYNPNLLFEAGHAARANGDDARARDFWARAAAADPGGPIGKSAREALTLIGPEVVTKDAPSSK